MQSRAAANMEYTCSSILIDWTTFIHNCNKADDSIMKKRDTTGLPPPGNSTATSAQPAASPGKTSLFRTFMAFICMSSRDQMATTYAVNMETTHGTSGEFVAVTSCLLYKPVVGVGHSTTNLPSDRLVTPPAESSNVAPITLTGDQRAAIRLEINENTSSKFLITMLFSELIFPFFSDCWRLSWIPQYSNQLWW